MLEHGFIDAALELIAAAFDSASEKVDSPRTGESDRTELSTCERELSSAIRIRRKVSPESADEYVRWLRSQMPVERR